MKSIYIKIGGRRFEAELYDTPTAQAIWEALPIRGTSITWGDEIYFQVAVETDLESDARELVEVGELAYWPSMPAFCIFFGPTPVSIDEEPRAASPVNVFGKLRKLDMSALSQVTSGEMVVVEANGA